MGCTNSKRSEPSVSPLEAKLISAVRAAKTRASFGKKKQSFTTLVMQFPKLRAGFGKVRELFKQLDTNSDGMISWEEFITRAAEIGLDPQNACIQEVFQLADFNKQGNIGSHEFILVFTIIYLLDKSSKTAVVHPEIARTLDIVEKAFTYFDTSSDGYLEKKEVMAALKSGQSFGRRENRSVAERVFAELDWDGSGSISFKEFLVGFERIVMEAYPDKEDEDEDEHVKGQAGGSTSRA